MPFSFPTPPRGRGGPPQLPEISPTRRSIWSNTLSIDDRKLSLPCSITSDSELESELDSMSGEDEFDALKRAIDYKVDSAEEDASDCGDADHEGLANYRFGSSVSTVSLSLNPVASLSSRIDDPNLPLYLRRGRGAASFLHISESTRSSQSSSGKGSSSGSDESRDIYLPQSEEDDNEPLTARPGNHLSFSAARRASMQAMRSRGEPEVGFNPWKARRSSISGTPVNGRRPSILPFNFEDLSIHEQELPREMSVDVQELQARQPVVELTNTITPHQPRLPTLTHIKPIPSLIGPEALPYAHNPSGINAYQFGETNLKEDSLFWPNNQQDLASSMRASVYNPTQRTPGYHQRLHSAHDGGPNQPYIRNPPRPVSGYTAQSESPHQPHRRTRRGQRSEAKQLMYQAHRNNHHASLQDQGNVHMPRSHHIIDRQINVPLPPQPAMPHLMMPQYSASPHAKTPDELHLLSLLEQLGDFERKGKYLAERVGQMMASTNAAARPIVPPPPPQQVIMPMLSNNIPLANSFGGFRNNIPLANSFGPQSIAPAEPPNVSFFSLPGVSRPVSVLAPVVEEEEMRSSLASSNGIGSDPQTQEEPSTSPKVPRPILPPNSSSEPTVTGKVLTSSTDTVKAPVQPQVALRQSRQNSNSTKHRPKVFADQENRPRVTSVRKPLPGINRALSSKAVNTPSTAQHTSLKGKGRV